jgi:hypothetical protein
MPFLQLLSGGSRLHRERKVEMLRGLRMGPSEVTVWIKTG